MKKIISLFQRNYGGDNLVRNEIVPGAEWVIAGEGIATLKLDGTCCMIRDGKLFKRYDAKAFTVDQATGEKKAWNRKPPDNFEPAQEPDPITGHWPGWVPVGDGPEDQYHREAMDNGVGLVDGTYELIGPKINGNPEGAIKHILCRHGDITFCPEPRDFDSIRTFFGCEGDSYYEGIVFHHPDGRMVKVKAKDFGIKRRKPS